MDIVKELTRLHGLAGETTLLNFRALMQEELRKLIEKAQEEAAQQSVQADECLCSAYKKHSFKSYTMAHVDLCEFCGTRR